MIREQRKGVRHKRRLQVDYGVEDFSTTGFGLDISTGGLFVTASKLLPIGARVHLRITSAQGLIFYAEGRVVRHKLTHQALRASDPQGLGIRFISPAEIVEGFSPTIRRASQRHLVQCTTPQALDSLLREQLGRGVIIVPTGASVPEAAETIDFHVSLDFSHDAPMHTGKGRVVQVLNAQTPDKRAVVLEVQDAAKLIEILKAAAE